MGNIERLASFIKFLNESNLVDFSVLKDDTEEGFNNRLKTQKYVYIGQEKFDLDLGYQFSRYKFGPYSSDLTEDYYDIDIYTTEVEDPTIYEYVAETNDGNFGIEPLPNEFDKKEFLEAVSNKDENWLEIATTLINVCKSYNDNRVILDMVGRIKPSYDGKYIQQVFDDLINCKLMDGQ